MIVWFCIHLCCLPVVESRSACLKLWKISAHQPQAPCLFTVYAGEAVIENNWVAEMAQIESSPFQQKVKILLWHVLSMISSLRVDARLARMPLKLVVITVALILTVVISLTL